MKKKILISESQYKSLLNELEKEKQIKYDAILVGGIDNRGGDKSLSEQIELLNSGLGGNKKIKGFRYVTNVNVVIDFINLNPGIPVYLFSAGCIMANRISKVMGNNNKKLYIIEPYAISENTTKSIIGAVANGTPSSNVFVGPTRGRGLGVVPGARSSNTMSHFDSLESVGAMTRNK